LPYHVFRLASHRQRHLFEQKQQLVEDFTSKYPVPLLVYFEETPNVWEAIPLVPFALSLVPCPSYIIA
jgi:hypothetical protein